MTKSTKTSQTSEHRAILYLRVSTSRQASEGMSLDDQRARLIASAIAQGYTEHQLEIIADEGKSGGSMRNRTGLNDARAMLAEGKADALFATKLDRVARKASDMLTLADESDKRGWRLVVLDVNLDTATPVGRLVLTIMAAVAEMERERIAERQRDSHAHRDSSSLWGLTTGPKTNADTALIDRLISEREAGLSLPKIAASLNADEIPTLRGGQRWYASTVKHVLETKIARAKQAA